MKFLTNLNEALRNIPDLPGEDEWGEDHAFNAFNRVSNHLIPDLLKRMEKIEDGKLSVTAHFVTKFTLKANLCFLNKVMFFSPDPFKALAVEWPHIRDFEVSDNASAIFDEIPEKLKQANERFKEIVAKGLIDRGPCPAHENRVKDCVIDRI